MLIKLKQTDREIKTILSEIFEDLEFYTGFDFCWEIWDIDRELVTIFLRVNRAFTNEWCRHVEQTLRKMTGNRFVCVGVLYKNERPEVEPDWSEIETKSWKEL